MLNHQTSQDQEAHPAEEQEPEIELRNGVPIAEVDELLPTTVRHFYWNIQVVTYVCAKRSHLRPTKTRRTHRAKVVKRDWAHVVDINKPMTNFRELVPVMAHKVSFGELPVIAPVTDGVLLVSFRAGYLPERSGVSPRVGRLCLRRCAYIRRENCGCRVCDRVS